MINIQAVFPNGEANRVYNLEVNGHKFSFEVHNDEQKGKEPILILRDELASIVSMINEIEKKNLDFKTGKKITLGDILDNGKGNNGNQDKKI